MGDGVEGVVVESKAANASENEETSRRQEVLALGTNFAISKVKGGLRFAKFWYSIWPGFLASYLVFLSFVGVTTGMLSVLPTFTLSLVKDYENPYLWVAIVSSTQPTVQLVVSVFIGSLSDRIGRYPVLAYAVVSLSLCQLMTGISPNIYLLIMARLIGGISGAGLAASPAYISDVTPPKLLGTMIGLLLSGISLGVILGALVTMIFATSLGFGGYSILLAILLMIPYVYIMTLVFMGNEKKSKEARKKITQELEAADEKESACRSEDDGQDEGSQEKRNGFIESLQVYKRCLARRSTILLLINNFLFMFVFYTPLTVMPFYVEDKYGLDPAVYASLGFILEGIANVPSSFVLLPLMARIFGTKKSLFIGHAIVIALTIPMAFMPNYWLWLAVLFVWFFFKPIPISFEISVVLEGAPPGTGGTVMGVVSFAQGCGLSLAPFVITMLYSIRPWIPYAVFAPVIGCLILLLHILSSEDLSLLRWMLRKLRQLLQPLHGPALEFQNWYSSLDRRELEVTI